LFQHAHALLMKPANVLNGLYGDDIVRTEFTNYYKQDIRSVQHGICPIAEFTSLWLICAAILAIQP